MSKVRYIRQTESGDFNFLNDCLVRIRDQRKLIYVFTGAVFVLAVVIALLAPRKYTAAAKVMPSVASSPGPSMSTMIPGAAMFYPNAAQADLYIEILKGRRMRDDVLARYGYSSPGTSVEPRPAPEGKFDEASLSEAVSNTSFSGNYKSGVVSISTRSADRELSAEMANAFVEQLDLRLQRLDQGRAAKAGGYFAEQVAEQSEKLRKVEEEKTAFLTQNRNYLVGDDPELRLQMERLEMDVVFHRQLLLTLLELKANNDLESEKSLSRLLVIEWAQPPRGYSRLTRIKSVIQATLGAALFALGLIVLRATYQWYLPSTTRDELVHSCTSVGHDAQNIVHRIRRPFKVPEQTGV